MYKIIKNRCYFATQYNGKILQEPYMPDYSEYLFTRKEIHTVEKQIRSVHRFWIYCCYFPALKNQTFKEYLSQYCNTIANRGFKVSLFNENLSDDTYLYNFEPIQDVYFDMLSLEEYYEYILDHDINMNEFIEDPDFPINFYLPELNYSKTNYRTKYSKGKGYGLRARGIMREALTEKMNIFTSFKKAYKNKRTRKASPVSSKGFPFELYDIFLNSVRNPRNKLLYILCGACSARIGQALSLTHFDIDLKEMKVYLTDPRSENFPIKSNGEALDMQPGRRTLLAKYGVDFNSGRFRNIGFKYNIPSDDCIERNLFFLEEKYRDLFFETYIQLNENLNKKVPYVFQTQNKKMGTNILPPSDAFKSLMSDIKHFKKIHPEFESTQFELNNIDGAFHSFRHMFGNRMADIAWLGQASALNNIFNIELPDENSTSLFLFVQDFTRKRMGQSQNSNSIKKYFNITREAEAQLLEYLRNRDSIGYELSLKIRDNIDRFNKNNLIE